MPKREMFPFLAFFTWSKNALSYVYGARLALFFLPCLPLAFFGPPVTGGRLMGRNTAVNFRIIAYCGFTPPHLSVFPGKTPSSAGRSRFRGCPFRVWS